MKHTNLSVVTICYKDLAGLTKTVNALRKQTSFDFEQLIVDGNSDDGTKEYLRDLNVPWKMTYTSERDRGLYDAMNKGTSRATGAFVWYLNSGDYPASPKTIEKLLGFIDKNSSADLIYGRVIFEGPHGRKVVGQEVVARDFGSGMPVSHPGIIFRRELVAAMPYPTDYRIISDWIVTRTLFKNARRTIYTGLIFAIFNLDGISSQNRWADVAEKIRFENTYPAKFTMFIKCGFRFSILRAMRLSGFYETFKRMQAKKNLENLAIDPTYPLF